MPSTFPSLLGGVFALLLLLPAVAPAGHHGHDHTHVDPALDRPPTATRYDVDAQAPWAASEYDGVQFQSDAPDNTTLPSIHAIYVHPTDAPNRFGQFAAMFQADARQASERFTTLYGRALRLDERLGDNGTPYLDITVVRSTYKAKDLSSSKQFALLMADLRARGLATNPDKKYLVWLDAKSPYCGQAELAQDTVRAPTNRNELSSIAAVYRPWDAKLATGGFCRGRSAGHELGHALGALQSVAPNAYDGAHCKDSAEDVMCNIVKGALDTGAPVLDYRQNDYWDPAADPAGASSTKLNWWAVNLSRFLCPSTNCNEPNIPQY